MRRSILILALCSLLLAPLMAQEAFYIYRNDGDFNGFFYDEVQEMRYSKIDLDSVEHDNYIMYEVQLADTLYRIPLAAIDSIGFQQPEIKFNPRVRFLKQDGYCEYLTNETGGLIFLNLPADMMFHVGDIVLGNPLDPCEVPAWAGNSAFEVTDIYQDGAKTWIYGSDIKNISDVFDQYITVEEIGIDKQGNIRRRIAGLDAEGMPRKVKDAEGKGEMTLIDFTGNVTREWNENTTKVDVTAEVGIKYKVRVAYNITWRRFMVKISHDLLLNAKPSIGLAINGSGEKTLEDMITIPTIMFPATCPVFQTDPLPELFVRWEGQIATRLNMPMVKMGIGDDVIFDNNNLFPISFSLHLAEDTNTESDVEKMLDLSTEGKLVGYAQAGIKFSADVSTASWMKKILKADMGLYLYCGPKIGGQFRIAASAYDIGWNGASADPYKNLVNSYLNIALISLDLEAKAKCKAIGQDPVERTFFNKNWSFLCDTVQFAPEFDKTTVDTIGNDVIIKLHPKKKLFLGYSTVELAICETDGFWSSSKDPTIVKTVGNWTISRDRSDSVYEYRLTLAEMDDLKAKPYQVCPYVQCGPWGKFLAKDVEASFTPPITIEMEKKHLEFNPNDSAKAEIYFKTNCPSVSAWARGSFLYDRVNLELLDSVQGRYKATFYAAYNDRLFDREISTDNWDCPYIGFSASGRPYKMVKLSVHQQENPLTALYADAVGWFDYIHDGTTTSGGSGYHAGITATRQGANEIVLSGSYTTNDEVWEKSETNSLSCTIRRVGVDESGEDILECKDVTLQRTYVDDYTWHEITNTVMTATEIPQRLNYQSFWGQPSSGTCDFTSYYSDQTPRSSYHGVMIPSEDNEIRISFTVGKPAQ